MTNEDIPGLIERINRIRNLCSDKNSSSQYYEAANLAQTVLYDTVGSAHPLMVALSGALEDDKWVRAAAAARSVVTLYEEGGLRSPRLLIAHEIEGDLLEIAQSQAESAEKEKDVGHKQVHLAIAAFLAGASIEDALRRICDSRGLAYDSGHSSIAKLQGALYQPSKGVEIISVSETKQITVWGDTRNKADHGKFSEITQTEIISMIVGIRGFLDKHLP